jgi:hypothetical protein
MREQTLNILLRLYEMYGEEIAVLPEIVAKIHPLLKDPIEAIRQLAIRVCGCLYQSKGETLVVGTITRVSSYLIFVRWSS